MQDVVVVLILLIATGYVGRVLWRQMAPRRGAGGGCGSCDVGTCGDQTCENKDDTPTASPLVQITSRTPADET